jgi:hypothetical protein
MGGVVGRAPNFLDHLEAEINGKEGLLRKSRYAEEKIILVSKAIRTLGRPSSSSVMLDGVFRADKLEPQLPPIIRVLICCDTTPRAAFAGRSRRRSVVAGSNRQISSTKRGQDLNLRPLGYEPNKWEAFEFPIHFAYSKMVLVREFKII